MVSTRVLSVGNWSQGTMISMRVKSLIVTQVTRIDSLTLGYSLQQFVSHDAETDDSLICLRDWRHWVFENEFYKFCLPCP